MRIRRSVSPSSVFRTPAFDFGSTTPSRSSQLRSTLIQLGTPTTPKLTGDELYKRFEGIGVEWAELSKRVRDPGELTLLDWREDPGVEAVTFGEAVSSLGWRQVAFTHSFPLFHSNN
jgi:hypothetical protein